MARTLQQAIAEGRAKARGQWRDSFAKFDRQFGLTEVVCRGCGHVIAKTMPVGPQKVRRLGQQTIIQEAVQMAYLANYREVLIEMSDGGKHVGNACVDCVEELRSDPDALHTFYAMDLAQWQSRGERVHQTFIDRVPVRVIRSADYIDE